MRKPVILFIHGFAGLGFELAPLIKIAKKSGARVYSFSYKEKYGQVSIKEVSLKLKEFIKSKKTAPDLIVGMSQGGIIASYYAEFLAKDKPKYCYCICSPFKGTRLAHISSRKGILDLRPNNNFLKRLRSKIKRSKTKYFGVWNPLDLIVLPSTSAIIPSHENKRVYSFLHNTTPSSKASLSIFNNILKEIKQNL